MSTDLIRTGDRAANAAAPKPLAAMRALAEKVAGELARYCTLIEIAGSIRRGQALCGDIDIVVLPRPGQFMELEYAILDLAGSSGIKLFNGRVKKSVLLRKSLVQCDVFFADHGTQGDMFTPGLPPNWGAMLLTWTGSKSHNIKVAQAAAARGWEWKSTRGLVIPNGPDAPEILSIDERLILSRLFGHYIEPSDRL
jgi:DNA polymerase/3'-5' exonuclease PolX